MTRKGTIPIEKNILVIDELGNELNSTWEKRAKQLVKKERAYYVNETTICLKNKMEETMENKAYSDILDKIDQIIKDNQDLTNAFHEVQKENMSKKQIQTIRKLYRDKEKTNRRMIKELRKIYDDQSGRSVRKSILKTARRAVNNGQTVDFEQLVQDIDKTR